ncbi:MAG: chromosomal replication initiator protein DnaA [Deltaproteobacteria bacterium]|nr:chromosomal replication initiator protein DnaA [Deltaproteobacteria bacterium]
MKSTWNNVKKAIKKQIPFHSFRMWIEPLAFVKFDGNCIFLSCTNSFSKKRIIDHYGTLIETEINNVSSNPCKFIIEINKKNSGTSKKKNCDFQLPLPNENKYLLGGHFLRRDFTFDQFVVGNNNDFAYSASLSLASRKKGNQNSLFLLSKTGMGKSHLTQAVGHHILSEQTSDRVYYITAEDFSNEMVFAFRNNSIDKFKNKYRNECDVLLLEDVHYLSGKNRTQIELALTLDTLFEANKKIIFSSCYLPSDIPKLNNELKSRLSCSLISNIDSPNFRTRVRILQKKAKLNGYNVSEDIISYLAGELTEDIRQLESGLLGITARSSLLGISINRKLAENVVKNIIQQQKNITLDVIKKLVCKQYNISMNDIVSRSRKQNIVWPRQIAMYLSRMHTDAPLQTIGKSFNRYHATALHSIGVVEKGSRKDSAVKKQVEFLYRKLETGDF